MNRTAWLASSWLACLAGGSCLYSQEPSPVVVRSENFDRDPRWEGNSNQIATDQRPTVIQDFGFNSTNLAGNSPGEIGGQVWRSSKAAFYAEKIPTRTFANKMSASGSFALTKASGGCALFFGWFNSHQPGSDGRPPNSFGWYLDGEGYGIRLLYFLMTTAKNRVAGEWVIEARDRRPTSIIPDGARHTWSISYEPDGNAGAGSMAFQLDDAAPIVATLPPGFKEDGVAFDRFGILNMHRHGGPMTIYFDDLRRDGKLFTFDKDPQWEGLENRATYVEHEIPGAHDFGYRSSQFAGGTPGEIGGLVWRTEKMLGYYSDRVGRLNMETPLVARGRIALVSGAPDSAVYLGWFNQANRDKQPSESGDFVGLFLEGPSDVGHYLRPVYSTSKGTPQFPPTGPVLIPDGKSRTWEMEFDPQGNGGLGTCRVALAGESTTLELRPGDKAEGAGLDRFGLFTNRGGGGQLRVYVDDLEYSTAPVSHRDN